jgi:hypothetical protein
MSPIQQKKSWRGEKKGEKGSVPVKGDRTQDRKKLQRKRAKERALYALKTGHQDEVS